jgi:glycogen phosphorylase
MTSHICERLPPLPEALSGLAELALDMRWSWSHHGDEVWETIAPEVWDITHNPWLVLQTVAHTRLKQLARDKRFRGLLAEQLAAREENLRETTWFEEAHPRAARKPAAASVDHPPGGGGAVPKRDTGSGGRLAAHGWAAEPGIEPEGMGTVAYFCMEFGLSEALPIYSGGLGILAGDFLKGSSDIGLPVVGVGLLYQQGYFRQALDDAGNQIEFFPFNDPGLLPISPVRREDGEWLCVDLEFPRRSLRVRVWVVNAGRVKLYLLDTNDPTNSAADRSIAAELYGGSREIRLQQEMVLGIGGWRVLRNLGIHPEICHLNEGHAALAVLERARSFMLDNDVPFDVGLAATRPGNLFTTHTPVEAGFDRFPPRLLKEFLGGYAEGLGIEFEQLLALGRPPVAPEAAATGQATGSSAAGSTRGATSDEPFNMAFLAIRGSGAVNAVSRLHESVSQRLFQPLFPRWPQNQVPVGHVTNGVHVPSWDSPEADKLWTSWCGKKRWTGGVALHGECIRGISDEELWQFRNESRRRLISMAREHVTRQGPIAGSLESLGGDPTCLCDPDILTLGFARRFTSYKRVNLLLRDPERLNRLLNDPDRPIQIVMAGKAHPADIEGKAMIREWAEFIRLRVSRPHVLFLVDYDMAIAEHLVHGVDIWLNTPRRPWEASGTSGMKVLPNGGLNVSELDGWWAEAYAPNVGWAIGDGREHDSDLAWDAAEAEQLFDLLEHQIIPEFYDRDEKGLPRRWLGRVRESMAGLAPRFSTNRMLEDYLHRFYFPGALALRERLGGGVKPAEDLVAWRRNIDQCWDAVRLVDYQVSEISAGHRPTRRFRVEVNLGCLSPDSVRVQLYAEPLSGVSGDGEFLFPGEPEIRELVPVANSRVYEATFGSERAAADFTARVVPYHPLARVPLEAPHIVWWR